MVVRQDSRNVCDPRIVNFIENLLFLATTFISIMNSRLWKAEFHISIIHKTYRYLFHLYEGETRLSSLADWIFIDSEMNDRTVVHVKFVVLSHFNRFLCYSVIISSGGSRQTCVNASAYLLWGGNYRYVEKNGICGENNEICGETMEFTLRAS